MLRLRKAILAVVVSAVRSEIGREPMRVREKEPKPEKKKINLPWWPVQFDLKWVERAYERKREPKTVNEKPNRA